MGYADELGNREYTVSNFTEIEWDVKKLGKYFKDCQQIYEDFLRMSDTLIRKFEAFQNDTEHTGTEAESSKAFIKECENPFIVGLTHNIQQLEDLQVNLMTAFQSVDKSDKAILKTTHLKQVIGDYMGYEASLKSVGDEIKELAQELNAECSAVGRYTVPEYKDSMDAMLEMTSENGEEKLVPELLKAFVKFDEAHKNDIKGSDFKVEFEILAGNIKKFMNGIGDGRYYDITTFNQTREKLDWKDPKDVLTGVALEDYETYAKSMEEYLKGMKERCEVYKYDPVNMCNGNYINEQDDLTIGGRYQIIFHRFYNAISEDEGVLGRGWTHSFETRLTEIEDGIRISYPDGSKGIYRKEKDQDFYIEEHGEPGILTKENDEFLIKRDNGDYQKYDRKGYLISDGNLDEEKHRFIYDKDTGLRKLVLVKAANGAALKLDYYEDGKLKSLTDHTGRCVSYAYSDKGYLTDITMADGSTRRFSYYDNGLIKDVYSPEGIISITNEYDEKNRTIKQSFPDGGVMTYEYDDEKMTTTATEQNGNKVVYTHDKLGRHIKTEYIDGTESFTYNKRNQKVSYTDKNGNTTRYAYDNKGHLTKIIDPKGYIVTITYYASGKPASIKGLKGETYKFTYDNDGHLFEVKNPLGDSIRYYYSDGKLIKEKDAYRNSTKYEYDGNGNVKSITDADGVKSEFEHDALGRVIVKEEKERGKSLLTYGDADEITSVTDALGATRNYKYNESKKIIQIDEPDGTSAKWEYNDMGKVSSFTDASGRKTKYFYNRMWKTESIQLPNGGILKYDYDALMRLKSITDPTGRKIEYEYDPNGNVIKVGINGNVINTYEYDECNRIIKVVDALGHSISYDYDEYGKVIAATEGEACITRQSFDVLGRITSTTDALGRVSEYSYTKNGKIESITDHEGRKTEFLYTNAGRMKKILFCGETKQEIFYDKKGRIDYQKFHDGYIIRYSYDEIGRVWRVSGNDGKIIEYTYDTMGRVQSVSENGSVTEYMYTPEGRIKSVKDAEGNIVSYEYDAMDNLVLINRHEKSDVRFPSVSDEGHVTIYEYDLSGRMIRQVDALGQEEKYAYDSFGRLVSKIDKEGYNTEFNYDVLGRIEKVLYDDGKSTEYDYDSSGFINKIVDWTGVTSVERDIIGRIVKVTDPHKRSIGYQYGLSDEKTAIMYPDGSSIDYLYDEKGRLSEVVDGSKRTLYDYDENGRLSKKVFPNDVEVNLSYLPGGYLKEMTSRDAKGIIDSYVYSYDESGRRRNVERQRRNLEKVSGIYHYDYDKNGRLTVVERNNELIRSYSYDSYGNRKSVEESGNVTSYSYDALDRLIYSEKTSPEKTIHEITAYNYDRRGNMTEMLVDGTVSKQFKFDATNKLVWGFDKDKGEASYEYNGFGKRIAAKSQIDNVEYIIDITKAFNDVLGRDVNGKKERYVYDDDVISMSKDEDDYYYLLDELGSVMRLTGTDGMTVSSYAYDEFGKALDPYAGTAIKTQNNEEGKIIQPFAFTGYQKDDITDSYFANARYYKADIGRFISRDKDMFMYADDPESLNLYEYCQNNPIEYYDPEGNWVFTKEQGREAHAFLQGHALSEDPAHTIVEMQIHGGSWHGSGDFGRSDIAIFNGRTVEIYEIKPISYHTSPGLHKDGVDQLKNYVDKYTKIKVNHRRGATRAQKGHSYNDRFNGWVVDSELMKGYEIVYVMYPEDPGMIYYYYRKKPGGKEPEPNVEIPAVPKGDSNDKDNSDGKGGGNITEFQPKEDSKPDVAAIVAIIVGVLLIALLVLLFIFGGEIIAAIVAALAEAFAWLCGILELAYQFFVNWGPNLCPNY